LHKSIFFNPPEYNNKAELYINAKAKTETEWLQKGDTILKESITNIDTNGRTTSITYYSMDMSDIKYNKIVVGKYYYIYNNIGLMIKTSSEYYRSDSIYSKSATEYSYDDKQRLLSTTYNNNQTTDNIIYDNIKNSISRYNILNMDRNLENIIIFFNDAGYIVLDSTYLIKSGDYETQKIHYFKDRIISDYIQNGKLLFKVTDKLDANGNVTEIHYKYSQKLSVWDKMKYLNFNMEYNATGLKTKETQFDYLNREISHTEWQYDNEGNITLENHFGRMEQYIWKTYKYDTNGLLMEFIQGGPGMNNEEKHFYTYEYY